MAEPLRRAAAETSLERSFENHDALQGSSRAPRATSQDIRRFGPQIPHRFFEPLAFGPNRL